MKEKKKGTVESNRSVLGWVSREDEEWVKGEETVDRAYTVVKGEGVGRVYG